MALVLVLVALVARFLTPGPIPVGLPPAGGGSLPARTANRTSPVRPPASGSIVITPFYQDSWPYDP